MIDASDAAGRWRQRAQRLPRRIGPGLRHISGVDEGLLDRVPTERARYTAMGGVVVGTASIAMCSMWFALTEVSGGLEGATAFGALLLALLWGVFVLNLDRWLITSTSGTWWRRASMLLPRLVLAVLFGIVIAEPIVLRVFESAVQEHVLQERAMHLDDLRSDLLRCNPVPDGSEPAADTATCAGFALSFGAGPAGAARELAGLRAERLALQQGIDRDTAEITRLQERARDECVGTTGPGLSGENGRGPECLERERDADQFAATHSVGSRLLQVQVLDTRIGRLEGAVGTTGDDFRRVREQLISARVDQERAGQREIGLLERFEALDVLTSRSAFLAAATWFVRVFFVTVDALPVLVKFFGGITWYDRLVDRRLEAAERVHTRTVEVAELETVEELSLREQEVRGESDRRGAEIRLENRRHATRMDAETDGDVDRLYDSLRAETVVADDEADERSRRNGTPVGPV